MLNRHNNRAFTLIELLVVISIVSLLMAILMPALGQARTTAKIMRCSANQRQIGIAMNVYATDHKDRMPAAVFANQSFTFRNSSYTSTVFWHQRLMLDGVMPGADSPASNAFICPLDTTPWQPDPFSYTAGFEGAFLNSYGVNPVFGYHEWNPAPTGVDYWWQTWGHKSIWGGEGQWVRLFEIANPSRKFLASDVMAGESLLDFTVNYVEGPIGTVERWYEWAWTRHAQLPYVAGTTGGTINVMYVDGHVAVARQGRDGAPSDLNSLGDWYSATLERARAQWLPDRFKAAP